MIPFYKDPGKRKLQILEIVVLVLLLPLAVHWFAGAMEAWSKYQQAEAYFIKGHDLLHRNQHAEARIEFEKAVELYPEFYACWEGMAVVDHFKGDHQRELDTYLQAAQKLPEDARIRRELAHAYHELGQHAQELEQVELAAVLDPSDPLTLRLLDRARREKSGDYPSQSVNDSVDWTESQQHYHGDGTAEQGDQ